MNTTPFHAQHLQLGAKMAPFAGYDMPISYGSINDEHLAVRNNAGVFDVSHMGEFIIRGNGAFDLIQQLSSNDVSKLYPGKVQYSCLLHPTGGIVDDMLVYQLSDNAYMLVVNAANIQKDWNYISIHNTANVEMQDISDRTALLAVQGPKASRILQRLTELSLIDMPYYTFAKGTFAGVANVLISATGYTGSGGFEIYFDNKDAETIWNAIFDAGLSYNLRPVGLAARNTLRLEKGYMLYGNDINDTTTPLEAGLGWITKLNKPNFIAKEALLKQKKNGTALTLVGFELTDKGVARDHCPITDFEGNRIGEVTSACPSPSLKKSIGMGYVHTAYAQPNTPIFIQVRDKLLAAQVVPTPFL
ncbi:MAG: glycine cleavage system aminomethyltransferase GcvT [Sphingobacteriales bacterium]|nr:glycine cleavage system aminomethyltransferase GcvT [Sphingobacteriales bacterium]